MKSNNALIGISVLCLSLAVLASSVVWEEVPFPVKIGMFAFGFASGAASGALIAKRRNQPADGTHIK